MDRYARPSFPVAARRLALVACLIAGLFSLSAGSALAMPHAKRLAKACKKGARASTVARPTPIRADAPRDGAKARRARRNRKRCVKVKVRRRVVAPRSPGGSAPSPPGGHEVHAGNVRVEFNNSAAEDPHDRNVVRSDGTGASYAFGELQSGQVEAKTVKLTAG